MVSKKVLVIGGTGYFGRLIVDDLHRYTDHEVMIASRRHTHTDLGDPASLDAALSGVQVVICAAGPFQRLPVTLAELCIRRRIHYIDIADDRGFVMKVRSAVATAATDNAPAICSGWSTVSALSGALAKIATAGMEVVDSIYIHMAPGNRGARKAATIESLLHSVGKPFTVFRGGSWQTARGWSAARVFSFPSPVGDREGYLVDVPDHELFPSLFHARTVEFHAGSEFKLLNRAVSLLRAGSDYSKVIQRAAAVFSVLGHDWGAIGVEVRGSAVRRVSIVADSQGPRIAAMPASVMANLLLSGSRFCGLVSHADWVTPEQLGAECEKRGFRLIVEGNP